MHTPLPDSSLGRITLLDDVTPPREGGPDAALDAGPDLGQRVGVEILRPSAAGDPVTVKVVVDEGVVWEPVPHAITAGGEVPDFLPSVDDRAIPTVVRTLDDDVGVVHSNPPWIGYYT